MEGWLIFFGIIGAIWFIVWLNNRVSSYEESKRRKKLDEIAHEVLAGFNFEKEREELESIKRKYSSPKYMCCPRCDGTLVKRKGIYGDFWGCTRYPTCKYTREVL